MRTNHAIQRNPEIAAEAMEAGEQEHAYTDDELVSLVTAEVRRSQQDYNSSVSNQREQAHRYYYGMPFGNERVGFSRHVSMDVFEGVEDVKAKILGVFTSGHQVLRFEQEMQADEDGARDATDYVHAIFYQQNRGYTIIEDTLNDGLVSKLATAELGWYERVRVQPEIFNDVPADQLNVLLADESIVDFKVTNERQEQVPVPGPDGQPMPQVVTLVSGEITRQDKVGQVKVTVHAPENVFITTSATDPADADCIVIRYPRKTKGELVAEGFDREIVEGLSFSGREFDNNRQARHSRDDTYDWEGRQGEAERDHIDVDVAYLELDMDGDYVPETWKVTVAGDVLLDKERIAKKPLHFWTPYRISHKAIGLSVADVLGDIQRTNSGLVRGVMDNIYLTNTSMKIADLSLIRNPRDLIDNPIGAVINSADPDAVKMVPQPQLNPATFDAIGLMAQQKAGRLGLTKLPAQQVISHQNSEDMINTLMAEGEERIGKMARSYAETFLKPLFIDIYNMGVEYGQVVETETSRGFRVLHPQSLQPVRHHMRVTVAITPEERAKRAQALSGTYQLITADEQMAPLFGVEQKYALLTDLFEAMGTSSPSYLMNPASEQGQQAIQQAAEQAQQAQQMQMQIAQQSAEAQIALAMARIEKMQAEIQKLVAEVQMKGDQQTFDALHAGERMAFDREKQTFHEEISRKELELEKSQARNVVVTGARG
jgi:hypothetical protein